MTSILVNDIGELVTCDPQAGDGSPLGILHDAAFAIDDGYVVWVGAAADAPATDEYVSAEHAAVVPGLVDSHTHLVFAGERSTEFAARMAGQPYTGGGIATTVAATRAADDNELRWNAGRLLHAMRLDGTTTVEAKSGYGLDVPTERRILEISREFTEETTFLGAHVVSPEFAEDRAAYVDLVCGEMMAACAPLCRWVDVFCDRGAFDADETREVLRAGIAAGLMPRLHGNQLAEGPGAQIAAEFQAASVDHCTYLTDADIAALADENVVATLLPGADFSTRGPYPNARRLLDAGVTVAVATDCNPGSSYITSMPLMLALAVRELHLTPEEALLAATRGGATALRRDDIGAITPGCRADFVILDAPSYLHFAYRPGARLISETWVRGERSA